MKLVGDFLSRFQNLTPPDDALRRAVAAAVFTVARVPAKKSDVSIANGVAFVRTSSVAKSAIRIKRGAILEEVFQEFPKARATIRDVR